MFKANKKENIVTNYERKIGFSEMEVVAVNPSLKELNTLYEREDKEGDKEPVYTGVTQEGNKYSRITFYLRCIEDDTIRTCSYFLEDKVVKSKGGKTEFLSSTGLSYYAEDRDSLPAWMSGQVVEALVGEVNLYALLKSWLYQHDWKNNEDFFDRGKLLKGDASEISSLIGTEITMLSATTHPVTFVGNVIINTKSTDDEIQYYENVYSKAFMPGYYAQQFKTYLNKKDYKIEDLPLETSKVSKGFEKTANYFLNEFKVSEYPIKGLYTIKWLAPFNPEDFEQLSEDTIVEESEDNDDLPF